MSKSEIRQAMLNAQSRWLHVADLAENPAERVVSEVIAGAFAREADRYKQTKETETNDWIEQGQRVANEALLAEGPTEEQHGFFGPNAATL